MTETLKICHVTTASEPIAGAERVLVDLARKSAVGWDLCFVTVEPSGELNEALAELGWPARSLGATHPIQVPAALSRLRGIFREIEPDIIHAHLHHASALCALTRGGTPLVQTRHYSDHMYRYEGPLARGLDLLAARRARRIAAVSRAVRDHLVDVENLPRQQIEVIPNGVDCETLARADTDTGGAILEDYGVQGPVVGCAATFHPRKGHVHLLDAWQDVIKGHPDAHLLLMGKRTDHPDLAKMVERRGLADSVHPVGFHPEGRAIMAAFDVYVQPSIEEGFGLAVIEAMAMGQPVVASKVGGMKETVVDGETGLHVPPGESNPLADSLILLLDDEEWARELGRTGQKRARSQYSSRRMVSDYDRFYAKATGT